jgi:hypothetical protein
MDKCPSCGSTRVYPSRHRSVAERLRQVLTEKRPYRCHQCNWRKWIAIEIRIPKQPNVDPQSLARPNGNRPLQPADMDRLDLPPGAGRIGASRDREKPSSIDRSGSFDPKA